jgi:hypothetical protein
MNHKKGAIELSVNFIIVIVISIVIVAGGFVIFYNLKNKAVDFVTTVDIQTQERLKAMMMSDNIDVVVYPQDLSIDNGKKALVSFGITNTLNEKQNFLIQNSYTLFYFENPDMAGVDVKSLPPLQRPSFVIGTNSVGDTLLGSADPKDQLMRGIFISMGKNAKSGQYIYTFTIQRAPISVGTDCYRNLRDCPVYGKVKVYITNP